MSRNTKQVTALVDEMIAGLTALRRELSGLSPAINGGQSDAPADLLYGVAAIATHLGITERRALYLKEKRSIPTFNIDKTVCARRSSLNEWLAEQEAR